MSYFLTSFSFKDKDKIEHKIYVDSIDTIDFRYEVFNKTEGMKEIFSLSEETGEENV